MENKNQHTESNRSNQQGHILSEEDRRKGGEHSHSGSSSQSNNNKSSSAKEGKDPLKARKTGESSHRDQD